jgi:hypothetical protein
LTRFCHGAMAFRRAGFLEQRRCHSPIWPGKPRRPANPHNFSRLRSSQPAWVIKRVSFAILDSRM